MTDFFNSVLSDTSSDMTVGSVMVTMLAAVIFGLAVAFTYYAVQKENYQKSLAASLLMLPCILSVIILFIGSNIARAFSLAGTLSIIRFRSAPGEPTDIGFIFFAIAAGLSAGVGLYGYGALFVLILCAVIIISEKTGLFTKKDAYKRLKITVPENLNYEGAFDEILKKYSDKYRLTKVKTTDLGSLFEIEYSLIMDSDKNERDFINELRCRNGNLNIMLCSESSLNIK